MDTMPVCATFLYVVYMQDSRQCNSNTVVSERGKGDSHSTRGQMHTFTGKYNEATRSSQRVLNNNMFAIVTFVSTSVALTGFLNSFWNGSRVASVAGKPPTVNGTPW